MKARREIGFCIRILLGYCFTKEMSEGDAHTF